MCSPTHAARLLRSVRCLVVAVVVIIAAPAALHAANFGPTPYLSTADSPFESEGLGGYFYVENFETGAPTQPGLVTSGVVIPPGPLTDSVDADDGAIDGSGTAGHSLQPGGAVYTSTGFNFNARYIAGSFNGAVLGALPTHAGLVWTDATWIDGPPTSSLLTLYVLGAPGSGEGNLIDDDGDFVTDEPGEPLLQFGSSLNPLGDGASNGGTAEDRFLGFSDLGGISEVGVVVPVFIGTGNPPVLEIDHVQYGLVPEPSAGAAALLLAAAASFRKRARR